jgi:hypothetical protein
MQRGDYFCTKCCPFDGWTSVQINELFGAAEKLRSEKVVPTVAGLRERGVSEEAIQRCIVIEFGDEGAAFDGLSPEFYVIGGKSYKLHDAGSQFK